MKTRFNHATGATSADQVSPGRLQQLTTDRRAESHQLHTEPQQTSIFHERFYLHGDKSRVQEEGKMHRSSEIPHPTVSTSPPPPPSRLQLLDKFVDVTKRAPAKLFGRSMNNRKRRGKTGPERFGNGKAWPVSDWPFHVAKKRKSSEGRRL